MRRITRRGDDLPDQGPVVGKPLSVIARNMAWMRELAFTPKARADPRKALGAITVILPKKPVIPTIVTAGADTVGLAFPTMNFATSSWQSLATQSFQLLLIWQVWATMTRGISPRSSKTSSLACGSQIWSSMSATWRFPRRPPSSTFPHSNQRFCAWGPVKPRQLEIILNLKLKA